MSDTPETPRRAPRALTVLAGIAIVFLLLAGLCTLLYGISMVLLVRAFRRAKERVETQKGAAASESGDKPTESDSVTDK